MDASETSTCRTHADALADGCAPGLADSIAHLHQFTRDLNAIPDLNTILHTALLAAVQLTSAQHATLLLLDASGQQIRYRVAFDDGNLAPLELVARPMMSKGLAGLVARTRTTAIVGDTELDPRWLPGPGLGDLRSALATPLIYAEQVLAVLTLGSETPHHFCDAHAQLIEILGAHTAIAMRLAKPDSTEMTAPEHGFSSERNVVALAGELRGLSAAVARLAPEICFEQELNRYIQTNSAIIRRYNGMMIQADSDTVLAVFEPGPRGARAAADAALLLQEALQQQRAEWHQRLGIRIGMLNIGIAHGTALLGSRDGDATPRLAIGSAVVRAAQLRKLARGGETLVAAGVGTALGQDGEFALAEVPPLHMDTLELQPIYQLRRS